MLSYIVSCAGFLPNKVPHGIESPKYDSTSRNIKTKTTSTTLDSRIPITQNKIGFTGSSTCLSYRILYVNIGNIFYCVCLSNKLHCPTWDAALRMIHTILKTAGTTIQKYT